MQCPHRYLREVGAWATVDRTRVLKAQPFANQPCIVNQSNHFHTYTESCNSMKQHVTGLIHTYIPAGGGGGGLGATVDKIWVLNAQLFPPSYPQRRPTLSVKLFVSVNL